MCLSESLAVAITMTRQPSSAILYIYLCRVYWINKKSEIWMWTIVICFFLSKEVFRQEAIIFKLCRTYVLSQRHDYANSPCQRQRAVAVLSARQYELCGKWFRATTELFTKFAHATKRNTSNCINLSILFHGINRVDSFNTYSPHVKHCRGNPTCPKPFIQTERDKDREREKWLVAMRWCIAFNTCNTRQEYWCQTR